MKFIRTLIPCLIFMSLSTSVFAQDSAVQLVGVTPMHEFLQENTDSTIVFHINANVTHIPEWFILSKKGDTLTAYHYHSFTAYDSRIRLPQAVALKLKKRVVKIYYPTVDINEFFNPIYMEQDTIARFWQNITKLKPWQIKDDVAEGIGCPVVKGKARAEIFDADGITVHLMTKKQIKTLYFYAPEFYQRECPRKGRKEVLELQSLFLSYFIPLSL